MKNDIKIVYMGTSEFSSKILEFLINNNLNVVGVVSQPDKEVGRKKVTVATPVKSVALKHNIEVFQPLKIRNDFNWIKEKNPDIILTCAYGQIVPQEVLDIPTYKCINIHGSLLPKYRGAAPVQYAILNGEKETGITYMEMIKEMDAGVMHAYNWLEKNRRLFKEPVYGPICVELSVKKEEYANYVEMAIPMPVLKGFVVTNDEDEETFIQNVILKIKNRGMSMRRLSGFSLMEMMTVLLIVSVIAAASAPMINKKMMAERVGGGDCEWQAVDNGIAYNVEGDDNRSTLIGTAEGKRLSD